MGERSNFPLNGEKQTGFSHNRKQYSLSARIQMAGGGGGGNGPLPQSTPRARKQAGICLAGRNEKITAPSPPPIHVDSRTHRPPRKWCGRLLSRAPNLRFRAHVPSPTLSLSLSPSLSLPLSPDSDSHESLFETTADYPLGFFLRSASRFRYGL
jgi:hypothetical protein